MPEYLPFVCDYDFSGQVGIPDLLHFAGWWLADGCVVQDHWCESADLDRLGTVDISDWVIFSEHWQVQP